MADMVEPSAGGTSSSTKGVSRSWTSPQLPASKKARTSVPRELCQHQERAGSGSSPRGGGRFMDNNLIIQLSKGRHVGEIN